MTEIEKREWEQVRAKGRDRFILREGILRRGLRDAGIAAAIWWFVHVLRHQPTTPPSDVWGWLAGLGATILVAGWIEGMSLWEKREKEYQEYMRGDPVPYTGRTEDG